jgi:predicted NAD/FAD-dependent oxidoreductase
MKTVIVGGGIAGLYAALQCPVGHGQTVEVYEASGRWGGNIATQYYEGYQYEAGAGRFNDHHVLLMELIRRYNLTPVKIQSVKHSCEHSGTLVPAVGKWAVKGTTTERQGMTLGTYLEKTYSKAYRKEVQEAFGYDAEFDWLNADDALRLFRTDFREGISYYFLKEGLTELVRRMVAELKSRPGVRMYLRRSLEAFEWDADTRSFQLTFNGAHTVNVNTNALYLALPKAALERVKAAPLEALRTELASVRAVPLHRIYGRFTQDSEYPSQRTTTRLPIRQYIPMNAERRLAMVSYSDAQAAERWHQLYHKDPSECKEKMEHTLTAMFQQCIEEPKASKAMRLRWIRSYFWEAGVHVWKAGISSTVVRKRVRFPLGHTVPCFIIGEAYSAHQGWIEGALQTVMEANKT